MSEDNNEMVVRELYSAFKHRNFSALKDCLTTDVKWFAIGPPSIIPSAGTRFGPDQVEQYFVTLEDIEGVEVIEPWEFVVARDKVFVTGALERRSHLTGNFNQSLWVHIFTLRKGKVSDFRAFYDTEAAVTSLIGYVHQQSLLRAS